MSKEDAVSTPNSERCGKKTMFPMVFAYEEAKSPRSPLGQLNLNTKFMVRNLIQLYLSFISSLSIIGVLGKPWPPGDLGSIEAA